MIRLYSVLADNEMKCVDNDIPPSAGPTKQRELEVKNIVVEKK